MIPENQFLVYENWTHKKAVVHNSSCGDIKTGHERLKDYTGNNDRWFGYFTDLSSAIAFASLLPERQFKLCGTCLKKEKQNL